MPKNPNPAPEPEEQEVDYSATEGAAEQEDEFFDPLAQAEAPVAPQQKDAHRASLDSMELETFDSGATGLIFQLHSIDEDFDARYSIFLPPLFVENPNITPDELPDEEGDKQRTNYAIGISNSQRNATLQVLRQIAVAQKPEAAKELAPPKGQPKTYKDINDFFDQHRTLLAGIELVFSRRPQRAKNRDGTPNEFAGRLEVKGIHPPEVVNNPKMFKGYRKSWEM
jgi:hypothetical protein